MTDRPGTDDLRERLARALHAAHEDCYGCRTGQGQHPAEGLPWAEADAILAALGPDVFLVTVDEVAERLWGGIYREPGAPIWDELSDKWRSVYLDMARRLLGGRE